MHLKMERFLAVLIEREAMCRKQTCIGLAKEVQVTFLKGHITLGTLYISPADITDLEGIAGAVGIDLAGLHSIVSEIAIACDETTEGIALRIEH